MDGFLYDFFVRTAPELGKVERRVVLVDVPVPKFSNSDVDWEALTDDVLALGARQVVFTLAPTLDVAPLGRIIAHDKVIVGGAIRSDPDRPGSHQFISAPLVGGLKFPAVSAVTNPLLGVYRYQEFALQVEGRQVPGIAALAARRAGVEVPEHGRALVNFGGRTAPFPRMTLAQVQEGGLIRSIAEGRVVMFGPALDRLHHSIVTPVTGGGREVSELEFHGHALDSLLRSASIQSLPPPVKGLVCILLWLICFLLLQSRSFRTGTMAASLVAMAFLVLVWLALVVSRVHVPAVAGLLVLGTTLVSVYQSKGQRQNRQLARLVNETTLLSMGGRKGEPGQTSLANLWPDVMAMLDQLFPLTRAVLLSRAATAGHVHLVQTLRCDRDVIQERRRDYRRTPYSRALDRNDAVEAPGYLKPGPAGESVLLVPMRFAGEVQGFLALGMSAMNAVSPAVLQHGIRVIGEHLSELMFERRRTQETEDAMRRWHQRLRDPRDEAIHQLSQNVRLISRHTTLLQDLVDSLDAATGVYDLFGRSLVLNKRMADALEKLEFHDREHTAVDLLASAGAMSLDQARSVMARVILDRLDFERTARIGGHPHLLKASMLSDSASAQGASELLDSIHGLMFQLFPSGNATSVGLPGAAGAIPDTGAGEAVAGEESVDVWHAIEQAVAVLHAGQHSEVAVNIEGDQGKVYALAPPAEFESLLGALLQLLAEDTRNPGSVTISIRGSGREVSIEMRNNGFGLPDDKLQAMLTGPTLPKSKPLRDVRRLLATTFKHGGDCTLGSDVGSGYAVRIVLSAIG